MKKLCSIILLATAFSVFAQDDEINYSKIVDSIAAGSAGSKE